MNWSALNRARPIVYTTISQGCSAGSNFVILLALGRAAGSGEAGRFVLAALAYGAALGLQRAMVTDALMARRPGSTTDAQIEVDRAVMCSFTISILGAAVVGTAGLLSPYRLLAIVAPFLIGMLAQDVSRYALFREEYHGAAALLDIVWFVISCSGFLLIPRHPGYTAALIIWGAGGTVSGVIGLAMIGFRPTSLPATLRWWRTHLWPSSRWLSLDTAVFNAELQTTGFGFTALAGATAFGAYQLAGSLVALSAFFTAALNILTVTYLTKRQDNQIRSATLVSITSFASVAAVTGFMMLFNHVVVHTLYGNKVHISNSVILVAGVIAGLLAGGGGFQAVLRARRYERPMPLTRLVSFFIFPPLAVLISKHNFTDALWVLAAEDLTYFVVLLISARRAVRLAPRLPAPMPEPANA